MSILKELAVHYFNLYKNVPETQKKYKNTSDLMGDMLLKNKNIKEHLSDFDFISKRELIDVFADYCADLQINVYDASDVSDYSLDLYLTKKTPLLKTETVFVRTGTELDISNYEKLLNLIEKSSKVGLWIVFVTTPAGVYKIGFDKLISDVERLNVWLYVVDPLHKKIHGITRGKKTKDYDPSLSEVYLQKLPREPVRATSQVIKFSKYYFKESESYKSKAFNMYDLFSEEEFDELAEIPKEKHKYRNIFRNLLIIDPHSGVSIFAYSSENEAGDDMLISGFLTAMDNFVSEIGGSTIKSSLEEIKYKGFFVSAGYGSEIKMALFLSEPADKILKERLAYFVKDFEDNYIEQINLYRASGKVSYFKDKDIIKKAIEILDI